MTSGKAMAKFGLVLSIITVFSLSACSKKEEAAVDENPVPAAENADQNTDQIGDSDSGKALGMQTIHFPYDSFSIDGTAKEQLKQNAGILKDKPSMKIQIEGHCDEHGGIQYNIALGEKRANAVRKYLMGMGIAGDRVTTISFGKEKPLDTAANEAADAKNRRANFVITTR